jgi:hypothetical protein
VSCGGSGSSSAGRHHLHEVGAVAQLLAHSTPNVVDPVRLPVHPGEEPAARTGGRDDPAAGQDARSAERAVAHRLPGLDDDVADRADGAYGRDPHSKDLAQLRAEHVRERSGQKRLGAAQRYGLLEREADVGVRVDEPGEERPAGEIDRARPFGRRLAGARHERDPSVLDEHRCARAVLEPCVRQPQAVAARRGIGDQGGEAGRHGVRCYALACRASAIGLA